MTNKIFKSIFFAVGTMLILCFALVMGVLYEYFGAQLKGSLENEAAYIAQGVEHAGMAYFEGLSGDDRVSWIAADGTVLYDTVTDAAKLENHADRAEVAEALEKGTGTSTRYSTTLSVKTIYYAQRLTDGTLIRVSSAQQAVWVLVLRMLQPILCIFVAALILSGVTAARLSKGIIRPINEIDLEHPEKSEMYAELTPLLSRLHYQNKLIAKQLREMQVRQQEFSAITENMTEGFLVVDHNTNLLSYNNAALTILGAARPADTVSVLTLNRGEAFREAVSNALGGAHNEQQMSLRGRRYQLIANPVQDGDDTMGAVLVILDVTEKEERENMRREFTANVSHELKTPLTSISSAAEVLRDGLVKPTDVPRFAGTIYDETQRLITLVQDIIKLSQLDEQSIPLEKEDVDLYALAGTVCARLLPAAAAAGVKLMLEGEAVSVYGVRQVLDEMLYNLCDNAIKYNRENGSVRVAVHMENSRPTVSVSDTGIGIPPAHQARVFERFYRVDKSHSKEIGGTGLGLSIVKHGAAFHNAQVKLQSEPDAGTTVTVTF